MELLKKIIRGTFPFLYNRIRAMRGGPYVRLWHEIGRALDWRVESGPFKAMRLPDRCWGKTIPLFLGSFEAETHPWIERLKSGEFKTVLNIGTAEGYVAIGFARCMPKTQVVAFERTKSIHHMCKLLAKLNEVEDQVSIKGDCTHKVLQDNINLPCLIFCDIDGGEYDLLDPEAVPDLTKCTMLIEMHDHIVSGATEVMTRRFSLTHLIEIAEQSERDPSHYPVLARFDEEQRRIAVDENRIHDGERVHQRWMLLTPKAN